MSNRKVYNLLNRPVKNLKKQMSICIGHHLFHIINKSYKLT